MPITHDKEVISAALVFALRCKHDIPEQMLLDILNLVEDVESGKSFSSEISFFFEEDAASAEIFNQILRETIDNREQTRGYAALEGDNDSQKMILKCPICQYKWIKAYEGEDPPKICPEHKEQLIEA